MSSYLTGLAAEATVARGYAAQGADILSTRYRCAYGEVDLISRHGDTIVFTEVKARRTIEEAAEAISPRQISRIGKAAESWLAEQNESLNTPIRIDAALLDRYGRVEIIENAGFH